MCIFLGEVHGLQEGGRGALPGHARHREHPVLQQHHFVGELRDELHHLLLRVLPLGGVLLEEGHADAVADVELAYYYYYY